MNMGLGIEMVVGVVLLFGGVAWFWSELEALGDRQTRQGWIRAPFGLVALGIAAVGGYIVWNGINGGPLLLDPDLLRPWLPDRFN
jgi:hypothetical protein